MPPHLPRPSSVWGCSIGRHLLLLLAGLALALGLTGCSEIPKANANIAFMGDSITAFWWLPKTNLGIYGDTAGEMLARFPTEVLGHGYKAVVILAGTNDVRVPTQPIDVYAPQAAANIAKMASMADGAGIQVILCKIPPIEGELGRVETLNALIETLAQQQNYKLVDYYAPMVGHANYFRDGEHPNDAGYFVMQSALTKVIPLNY